MDKLWTILFWTSILLGLNSTYNFLPSNPDDLFVSCVLFVASIIGAGFSSERKDEWGKHIRL